MAPLLLPVDVPCADTHSCRCTGRTRHGAGSSIVDQVTGDSKHQQMLTQTSASRGTLCPFFSGFTGDQELTPNFPLELKDVQMLSVSRDGAPGSAPPEGAQQMQ
ncbi:TPA: hypothetical protein ACH3X3_007266 [Trebouxia sp. C0006]